MTQRITLAGLLKVELPGHTVRLVDGGVLVVGGETYTSRDSLLGVVDGYQALTEGVSDEAPAGSLIFLPPNDAPATAFNSATNQGARVRIYVAEVDADTGLVIGSPQQEVDWIVDFPALTLGMQRCQLELACVSGGDRLFQLNRGNSLSPTYHRGIHPGEAGLDNASGVSRPVPWGAASAPRGTTSASASATGYGGSFGGLGSQVASA